MVCFCVLLTTSLPNPGALNQGRSAPWRIETFLALTTGPGMPPSLQRPGHSPQQRITWPRNVGSAEVGRLGLVQDCEDVLVRLLLEVLLLHLSHLRL